MQPGVGRRAAGLGAEDARSHSVAICGPQRTEGAAHCGLTAPQIIVTPDGPSPSRSQPRRGSSHRQVKHISVMRLLFEGARQPFLGQTPLTPIEALPPCYYIGTSGLR